MDTPIDQSAGSEKDLSALSNEELQSREQDLVSQFDAADQADDLDTMSAIADQIDAVRAEMKRKGGTEKETPAENAAEGGVEEPVTASAEEPVAVEDPAPVEEPVTAAGEEPAGDAPVTDESVADPEPNPTDADAAAGETLEADSGEESDESNSADPTNQTDSEPAEVNDNTEPEATTADGSALKEGDVNENIPEDRQPEVEESRPAVTITAGANVPNFAAGTPFTSGIQLAQAMGRQIEAISRPGRGGEGSYTVATITAAADPSRVLEGDGSAEDFAKIEAVTARTAITASGGYCAPLETRYDIFGTGTTARPVKDALAGFQTRRGGIRFTAAPKIEDFAGALGLWTAANDANPAMTDPDATPASGDEFITPKPSMKVQCQPEVTATLDAITLQLEFGNLASRAYPELIDRNNQLALVAHARYAERALLSKMTALSTSVTSAFKLGAARDFLSAIGRGAAAYRNRYRMEPTESLRVIAPVWVLDMIREDLAYQAPGDDQLAVADATITAYLNARNVNVSWHLDGTGFAAEADATTLDDFPASFEWYIYAEGAFLFLDGGTLDLGVVRDAELVGTNDYKTFTEAFEGVARIGADSIKVTTTTKAAGAYAASVNTAV